MDIPAADERSVANSFAEISAEIPAAVSEPHSEEVSEETIEVLPVEKEAFAIKTPPPPPPPPPPPAMQVSAPQAPHDALQEIELDQEYELVLSPEPETEVPETVAPPARSPQFAASQALASDEFLADLANEIDQLGIGELTPSFSEPAAKEVAPVAKLKAEAPASPAENEPLKEVFEEFRAELGEMGAEDEDLETHYNLGIAFREMGLLEEAISEFQKVAKANERGKAFRYAMQCCTLLGLAFMEKGQPSIAAIWYERALRTPGVDAESTLALRYDLGVAQESANDLDAALKSFSQVYAVNIDYRGVADRIAALQKTTR
jgi:tetratricopeptide (TPR) repeat protein